MERLSKIERFDNPAGDDDDSINWEDFIIV